MEIAREEVGAVTVVTPQGPYIDASNIKEYRDALMVQVGAGACVLLDLSRIDWMDSCGCGSIITLLRFLQGGGGELKICSLSKRVRSLFQLIRLHRACDVFNNRPEALAAFRLSRAAAPEAPPTLNAATE
jgi:anti-sigma B factor antagonist